MRHALLPLVAAGLLLASLPAAAAVGVRTSTYVGDTGYDFVYDVAVDREGNALAVGIESFPDWRGQNVFIKKYAPDGRLLWDTIFGRPGERYYPAAIAVDDAGNGYVVGFTSSVVPFTDRAWQPHNRGETDAFVIQVMANGGWGYASMLGGSGYDAALDVDVDAQGAVYVVGNAGSCNFPTAGVVPQRAATNCGTNGWTDEAFVTKFNPGFSSVAYSTFLGGTEGDTATTIAVSRSSGSALVGGYTRSADFDVTSSGGLQRTHGGGVDGFVVKLEASGARLLFGTYLGRGTTAATAAASAPTAPAPTRS